MAIKKFRPITPARRFMSVMDTSDITSKPTVKSLLVRVKAAAGRNNNGRITSRHKEAGAKKYIELLISKEINSVLKVQFQLLNTIHIETVEFV